MPLHSYKHSGGIGVLALGYSAQPRDRLREIEPAPHCANDPVRPIVAELDRIDRSDDLADDLGAVGVVGSCAYRSSPYLVGRTRRAI
jgi:hypothetical protein